MMAAGQVCPAAHDLRVGANPAYQRHLKGRAPDDSDGVEVQLLPLAPVFGMQT
jgi:hypothetical protein